MTTNNFIRRLLVLVLMGGGVSAPAAEISWYAGTAVKAAVDGVQQGQVTFRRQADGEAEARSCAELAAIDFSDETSRPEGVAETHALYFVTGERVLGSLIAVSSDSVTFTAWDLTLTAKRTALRSIRWLKPEKPEFEPPALDRRAGADIVKLDSDTLQGDIIAVDGTHVVFALKQLRGIMSTLSVYKDDKLRMEWVMFEGANAADPAMTADQRCRVHHVNGVSEVRGILNRVDANTVELSSDLFGSMVLARPRIKAIWFVGGQSLWLSDLDPISVIEESPWGGVDELHVMHWRPKRDLNCHKDPLMVGGQMYKRGIGMHAKTTMTYAVPADYKTLEGLVGIDSTRMEAARQYPWYARAEIKILVDQTVVLTQSLSALDAPVTVKVSVDGAKTVSLVADYGPPVELEFEEKGEKRKETKAVEFGDWVNWAAARLVK